MTPKTNSTVMNVRKGKLTGYSYNRLECYTECSQAFFPEIECI